jgi:hypothetical protein
MKRMILILTVIGIASVLGGYIAGQMEKPNPTYQLERTVYDSLGNEHNSIRQYDHIPTCRDSVEFYK